MGKQIIFYLSIEQRKELDGLISRGNAPARTRTRACILLLTDRSQGQKRTDEEVAKAVFCSKGTVGNVRRRHCEGGLETALYGRPRPGAEPKVTGDLEAKLTMLACSAPSTGQCRWTLRLLADKMVELGYVGDISHVTVGEHLKKTDSSSGG
jgi:transposase